MIGIGRSVADQKKGLIFRDLFNPNSVSYVQDPYFYYQQVREQCPIYKTPYGVYILTKFADIQSAMMSKSIEKNYWGPLENIYGKKCYQESGFSLISRWLINKNPPLHTQLRRILTAALSPKKLAAVHGISLDIADELINKINDLGSADLLKEYAYKLPALVIYRLLGIPESDHDFLFKLAALPNVLFDPRCIPRNVLDTANKRVDELTDYFSQLCKERAKNLGEDLISLLLRAIQDEKLELSEAELVSNIFFLFGAGHETTMNLISSGLYSLYANPESLALLKNNWDLMPQAIEEMLRYESPVQIASPSMAVEDFEINGYCIPKGSVIMPILGAGCRDPEAYPDPNKFDITRPGKRTLAFGYGIHLCLGAQLARIEGGIAIRRILERLPNLNLEFSLSDPLWRPAISIRGLYVLPAKW